MSGKADEIDIVMAIENIGNELKKTRTRELNTIAFFLEDIAGSLELIALAMQGVYK
jgi:hypothetical protein